MVLTIAMRSDATKETSDYLLRDLPVSLREKIKVAAALHRQSMKEYILQVLQGHIDELSDLLTMREVQHALNLSYFDVREYEIAGKLPSEKIGGMVRFRPADVERLRDWIKAEKEQAGQQEKIEWGVDGLCDCQPRHALNARSPKGSRYLYRRMHALTCHADWQSHRTSSIDVLSICRRTKNCLINAHVSTLGALVDRIEFVTRQPNFGQKSAVDLHLAINKFIKGRNKKFSDAVRDLYLNQ